MFSSLNSSILPPKTPHFLESNSIPRLFSCFKTSFSTNPCPETSPKPISSNLGNFSGVTLEDAVELNAKKLRVDAWICSKISGISRARVQSSIKSGLVSVNGRQIDKSSYMVRSGDKVNCTIAEMQQLKAEPEEMPLDIVYEDAHLLVIHKPAHLVVHPAPGNATGTLVNGILHHCSLPTVSYTSQDIPSEDDDASDEELNGGVCSGESDASIRPGIVHRLDKGTSGLLVVAKDEHSHAHLAEQFKSHTIKRIYISLTCGIPSPASGRIDVPIGRDSNNRLRMVAVSGSSKSGRTRHAASRYRVIEILAGGGSALVEWKLETGRTHQIRAHAKYLGIPLLGDEVYGGTKGMALALLQPKTMPTVRGKLMEMLSKLERPCLHALTLGFQHPHTGENMNFSQLPPEDFAAVLTQLREFSKEKVHR
ncbi:RNA processing factor [Lithospermum erythrorhizon]|uniref:Pseudouridine synthase n=1 Tax=Lithospermum erythrorhizon TaxID=34254 RepID=A0AAV3NRV1_LITER